MRVRVLKAETFITNCTARLPFRFGAATLTWAPLLLLRLEILDEKEKRSVGHASELLVPKWFDKSPEKTFRENIEDLLRAVKTASSVLLDRSLAPLTVFELWWHGWQSIVRRDSDATTALVRGFGLSLVERALIDGLGRGAGASFFDALKRGILGFEPARIHPALKGWSFEMCLPTKPLSRITLRHTIGLDDPLRGSQIPPERRRNDGLPEALDEDIESYGVYAFKIKLSGSIESDLDRLLDIASVLQELSPRTPLVTVDGNEQFNTIAQLVELFARLEEHPRGRWLLDHLSLIEQPLPRARSFDAEPTAALRALKERVPCIIDEADVDLDSFPRALAAGYDGVSVKGCKGVFRALLNYGICKHEVNRTRTPFQTAEDLTCLPVVSLHQDLTIAAALGINHAERNGHHYFRGLEHLPNGEALEALEKHSDLYEQRDGLIQLRIRDGALEMGSLQEHAGLGIGVSIRAEWRTPLGLWSFPESA